jgi:DNA replication protein DnaC
MEENQDLEREQRAAAGRAEFIAESKRAARIPLRYRKDKLDSTKPRPGQEESFPIIKEYFKTWTPQTEHGLIVKGAAGSGKTMVVAVGGNEAIERNYQISDDNAQWYVSRIDRPVYEDVYFISSLELLNHIRTSYNGRQRDEEPDILTWVKKVPLLILDDLGAERLNEWALEIMLLLIDARYNGMKSTVITTNLTLAEMTAALGERITDRLRAMCRVVNITSTSQRETAQ